MRLFVLVTAVLLTVPAMARQPFGTLTVVQAEPIPGGPSPLSALTESDWRFVELVYAPLYSKSKNSFTPWLARGVSQDKSGRRLTVMLADNAQWSTGRDVTAKDVVYTYELARAGKWNRAYAVTLEPISEVRIADNGIDIEFELKHQVETPEALLTVPLLPNGLHGPLNDPSRQRPLPLGVLGAGPFKLKTAQDTATLVFNSNCIRRPHISEVRFVSSGEPGLSIDMVRLNGDTVTFDTTPDSETIASREFAGGHLQLTVPKVVMVAVGSAKSGWTNPTLAQAVRKVVHRKELFSTQANERPSTVPLPPGDSGDFEPTNIPAPDVAGARKLLEAEGWTQTFGTKVYTRKGKSGETERLELPLLVDADDNTILRRAFILRQRFLRAGIDLRIDARPRLELLSRLASREFSAALVSLQGDLLSLFHSKGAWNFSGFSDDATDTALRSKQWAAATKRIIAHAPSLVLGIVPRSGKRGRNVMAPRLTGLGGFSEFYKWRIR